MRPKDWDVWQIIIDRQMDCSTTDEWVEAGADAMLEALKAEGSLMSPEQMKLIAPDRKYPYGWLVFIEEK